MKYFKEERQRRNINAGTLEDIKGKAAMAITSMLLINMFCNHRRMSEAHVTDHFSSAVEERALLHAFSALPSVFSTQSFPCPLLWVHLECQLLKRNVKIGFGIFFKRNVKIGFGFPTHKSKWGIHVLALVFIYKN